MHRYKELKVWQKSMGLAKMLYEITEGFPPKERFGLTSQIRRNAVSIPSNIAEGAGRNTNKSFCHFLSISQGSLFELETQLLISKDLKYVTEKVLEEIMQLIKEIGNMLFSLQRKLKSQFSINAIYTLLLKFSKIVTTTHII
jgi:four helix bundle protein